MLGILLGIEMKGGFYRVREKGMVIEKEYFVGVLSKFFVMC